MVADHRTRLIGSLPFSMLYSLMRGEMRLASHFTYGELDRRDAHCAAERERDSDPMNLSG